MLKSTTSRTLRLYMHHVWRYPKYTVGVLVTIPVTILINQFLPPLIVADVLNRLSKGAYQPHHVWASFGSSLVLYAVLMLVGGVVMWRVLDYFLWRLEGGVEKDMARRVFNHLINQSANFHANSFGGSLVSQTNKLVGSYVRFADTFCYQTLPLLSGMVFTTIILSKKAPLFVTILLIVSLAYIFIAFFITKKARVLNAKHAGAESRQTGYLADAVTNVMAIKSFAGTKYETAQFNELTDKTEKSLMDVLRGTRRQVNTLGSITNSISALALVMAVIGVMVFKSNIATVYLILSYTSSIAGQLWTFGNNSLRNYNRSFGDAYDMIEILDIEPEIKDPEDPEKSKIKEGVINFVDVDFTHEGVDNPLFHGLNVNIASGEKVGLVGHSGSGKTTFMRLLLRFSDIDGGEILIDGQNIAKLKQDDLRRSIAYVPQEPIMFHRSLKDNIRYGQFGASDEDVIKAAKLAHAHEFIEDLPKGYDTLVGERGIKLSGGQRQRVAIARALLKNAPILVLDEATSALDSESEVLIQDALWKLMKGRTAIVIAHRLSTVQRMDNILVMDDGEIVEQGTHKKLLEEKGIYANLWAHQSGGFIDE